MVIKMPNAFENEQIISSSLQNLYVMTLANSAVAAKLQYNTCRRRAAPPV